MSGPENPPAASSTPARPPGTLRRARRLIRIVFGFTLLLVAAAAGLIPGVPGWPLGLLGLGILAAEYVWARKLLDRIKKEGTRLRDALWPWRRKRRPSGAEPGPVPRK